MSVELTYLAYSVALLFVLVLIQATANVRTHGGMVLANNRDNVGPPSVFGARALRTVANLKENLWFFAPLVLIAAITGVSNSWTVLGAQLFFFARVGHAIIYLAGWPFIRPLFWVVGIVGCALIFLALFGVLA